MVPSGVFSFYDSIGLGKEKAGDPGASGILGMNLLIVFKLQHSCGSVL